jgi:pentalenene oxygenase
LEPAFRPRPVKAQVPTMADLWFDALASGAGTVVDLRDLCYRLVVQMSGRAVLGVDVPEGAEDDVARLARDDSSKASIGSLRRALVGPARRARRQELTRLVADVVGRRRRDWSGDDLVSEILRGLPHGAAIPPVDALAADAMLLLRAGADATAHQILWTLLLLGSRPDWVAELRDELDGWTVSAATDIGAFPKLHATLVESERLRPVIPASVRVAAKDLAFSSRIIPAGTTVLHAATLPHFLDEVHDDPMAFRPERFLSHDVELGSLRPLATYGGGAHRCLGQPLARVQSALAVAIVTKHADLTPVAAVSLRARLDGVVTPVERDLPTRLTLRM